MKEIKYWYSLKKCIEWTLKHYDNIDKRAWNMALKTCNNHLRQLTGG